MASESEPEDESAQEEERPGVSFSLPQILGGALAAATSAVIGSTLGVAGTIIGASLASVLGAVCGTVYTAWIDRGARGVGKVVKRGYQRVALKGGAMDERQSPDASEAATPAGTGPDATAPIGSLSASDATAPIGPLPSSDAAAPIGQAMPADGAAPTAPPFGTTPAYGTTPGASQLDATAVLTPADGAAPATPGAAAPPGSAPRAGAFDTTVPTAPSSDQTAVIPLAESGPSRLPNFGADMDIFVDDEPTREQTLPQTFDLAPRRPRKPLVLGTVLAALIIFAITFAVITGWELLTGRALDGRGGTTISQVVEPEDRQDSPPPSEEPESATPTPTDSAQPTASPTPQDSAEPTATPSQEASPQATSPEPTASQETEPNPEPSQSEPPASIQPTDPASSQAPPESPQPTQTQTPTGESEPAAVKS
ncbi:MAG: hypothetical protein LBR32_11415 [Propionibacteriaceae bacterium]|jgi:hypothetical protein|nr:hypothetical protein [Propionibacteriaceae bacterium]